MERIECQPFIINAARGGVTSNRSLVKALKEKRISGAVMDCWENEPTIDGELLKMADIATPHIAGIVPTEVECHTDEPSEYE